MSKSKMAMNLYPNITSGGSISQLDRDVTNDSGSVELKPGSGNLIGSRFGPYENSQWYLWICTSLLFHRVGFLPGASVANSMVVVGQDLVLRRPA